MLVLTPNVRTGVRRTLDAPDEPQVIDLSPGPRKLGSRRAWNSGDIGRLPYRFRESRLCVVFSATKDTGHEQEAGEHSE
jgi:hypothetical protein